MKEYRKTVPLDLTTEYWFVELGEGVATNATTGSYPFPTETGAWNFAYGIRERDPKRRIVIRFPDGVVETVKEL